MKINVVEVMDLGLKVCMCVVGAFFAQYPFPIY